ncbi:Bug family tripartite tricarboxylate transporter substrate binding protein [Roseomonas populi]|uniref:Tripartite tricarboxylate transporter substrate-binding protein n=1 Tax=Roseomonas populi TaxID=3121582 RepID=A0ABT1XB34_9PROT|nr:tripartite tricarboxylate transporter substrate-binding protein [Roseomonas pecuniae]MCR0985333.1 tripartite tricarboxylate transporter substrate-binding protein [Roseomonas pecuniae]
MPVARRTALALSALFLTARGQAQQGWAPARSIRMIVPYAPGGGADTTGRLVAGPMGEKLGQSVVVENRGGAGGTIGAAELARSAPDGLTVMMDALGHVAVPFLMPRLPLDYATAFAPISQVTVLPLIVIVPKAAPYATLAELLADARRRPGQLSYGSAGNATSNHLAGVLLARQAGVDLQHIPYRGGGVALQDVVGGRLTFMFATVSSATQLVRDGQVKALAVSTAARIAALPDLPTIAEQGFPGYEFAEWNGFYAPAGTPPEVVGALYGALKHALADANVVGRLDAMGAQAVGSDPATFAAFLTRQRQLTGDLIRSAGIQLD